MNNDECYYRVSVKGIVIDENGKVLISRESSGRWDLMGGGLDHDEDPHDGLKREIFEETGLEVTYISPTPIYFITSKNSDRNSYLANVIYEIKLKDMNFIPSDECQELRFVTPQEASELEIFSNVKKMFDAFDLGLHSNKI